MKKRGVALAFLIGIVIALIIFVPTVMFISKLFTAGMQARDSTEKLTQEIIALSQGNTLKKVEILTMDENSAVLGFNGLLVKRELAGKPEQSSSAAVFNLSRLKLKCQERWEKERPQKL